MGERDGGQVFAFAHLVQNPFRAALLHKVGGALLLASDSLNQTQQAFEVVFWHFNGAPPDAPSSNLCLTSTAYSILLSLYT